MIDGPLQAGTGWRNRERVSDSATPTLALTGIVKRFGPLEVLRGVDLAARSGEVVAIIGSSGSGKSTLLRCANLLEVPEAGDIAVGGETLKLEALPDGSRRPTDRAQVDRIRASLGMVFQQFNLWSHLTILENVIEAPVHVQKRPRTECVTEAEALLEKVGIFDKRDHYPAHLSGGQQQRAAIARALAMRPSAMLFDEPTSSLDPELVGEVLRVIRALAEEGRTMLLVTHELGFAREVASRAVFLHRGAVEEDGTPAQVFGGSRSERCRQFIAAQLR